MTMRIGVDFGTTNSGAAVFDGRRVRVFPLDPTNQDPTVIYLQEIRERVEAETGQPVQGVVLGRPVHFVDSGGEDDDQIMACLPIEDRSQSSQWVTNFKSDPL